MIREIQDLEKTARLLETTQQQRNNWNSKVIQDADAFLQKIETLNAYDQSHPAGSEKEKLGFPETGRDLTPLLEYVNHEVNQQGINPASGKHLGYVPGGGIFPSALGDYMASITNRYAGIYFANPGAIQMENDCIRWMCKLVGYPETALGNLASGGSIATLIAITTARNFKQIRARDIENSVIYLTEQVHHCLQKALRIAGLDEAILHYVPMDEEFRMNTAILEDQLKIDIRNGLKPFLLVGSAGTTDTGAIDPLNKLADLAQQYDLWFHIDAAYGGFFMLVEKLREAFKGIERSDSITIDPHKGLFLSYGLGAVLIKNVKAQYQAHYYKANYMQDALPDNHEWSPADLSPELTKHFRGLRMWLPLQLFGLQPFRAALKEKVLLSHYFYNKIQELGFEVGPFPHLSILIFRYPTDVSSKLNEELIKYIQEDGRVFLSSTTINGQFWLRLAVMCFRTHLKEIDLCLDIINEGLKKIEAP